VIKGLSAESASNLIWQRLLEPFTSLEDMFTRVKMASDEWDALARTGALTAFAGRRGALWELGLLRRRFAQEIAGQRILDLMEDEMPPALGQQLLEMPLVTPGEVPAFPEFRSSDRTQWDFALQGITSSVHPVAHYRPYLTRLKIQPLRELYYTKPGFWVRVAGVVVARQRPPTAKGFCFIELEDETGLLQVALPPKVFDEYSRVIREPGLVVEGKLEGVGNHRSILGNRFKSLESVLRHPHIGGYSSHPGQMAR
jgi:error-prone DNA polymerase